MLKEVVKVHEESKETISNKLINNNNINNIYLSTAPLRWDRLHKSISDNNLPPTTISRKVRQYTPLKLDEILTGNDLEKEIRILVSVIIKRQIVEQLGNDQYKLLKVEYLANELSCNHSTTSNTIREAERLGIIDIDRHYIEGVRSRGYRLTPDYWEYKIKHIEDRRKKVIYTHPVHSWLSNNLSKISGVDFDIECYNPKDDFGHRYHSTLTNTKVELLSSIQVDGESVVELDASNCQPLLLCCFFERHHITATDAIDYQLLCQSGQIYDVIASDLNITRQQAKDQMVQVVFFGTNKQSCAVTKWLTKNHPSVMGLIKKIKKTDYTRLAKNLQRQESKIFIYGVCDYLRKHHPSIFVATRHDSILTTEDNAYIVREVIAREMAKYNILANIKEKSWL